MTVYTRSTDSERTNYTILFKRKKRTVPPPQNPPDLSLNAQRAPYQASFEAMTPNSEGSHSTWKNFQHYKRWQTTESIVAFKHQPVIFLGFGANVEAQGDSGDPYLGYDPVWTFGSMGRLDSGLPKLYDPVANGDFVSAPASLEMLKQRSLSVMLPIIKAELSLVNSIIELKDFKTLPRTLKNLSSFVTKTSKTLREYFRASSDVYLQGQFNILPLLSDISGIRAALSRTERRINDFITRQGRTQLKHFAFNWYEYGDSYSKSTPHTPAQATQTNLWGLSGMNGTCYTERFVFYEPSSFHAQIQYNYNYTGYQLAHAQVLALLDALGVNLNPSIIWNAIPWSFVVDWVLGVSRWLSQFQLQNMEPVINIHRYLWSVRRQRRILCQSFNWNCTSSGFPSPPSVPLPVITETAYRRSVSMPSSSSIQTSGLSTKEFTLGAALVLSRKRRRR